MPRHPLGPAFIRDPSEIDRHILGYGNSHANNQLLCSIIPASRVKILGVEVGQSALRARITRGQPLDPNGLCYRRRRTISELIVRFPSTKEF